MGLFEIEHRSNQMSGTLDKMSDFWYTPLNSGGRTESGAVVTRDTAMACSAASACLFVIAKSVSTLPIHVMKRIKGSNDTEILSDHPAQDRLKGSPEDYITSSNWQRLKALNYHAEGNSFAVIVRSAVNPVKEIVHLDPTSVTLVDIDRNPYDLSRDKGRGYLYKVSGGGTPKYYRPKEILHTRSLSFNKLWGDSPITKYAKEQVGLSLEMGKFQGNFFKQGLNPGGVITFPQPLGEKNKASFLASLKKKFGGNARSKEPLVLEKGGTFAPYNVSMADQQLIQLLGINVTGICGIMGVPESLISISNSNTNYNNSEQEKIRYHEGAILPFTVQDEGELNMKLLSQRERSEGVFIKYNFDAFLRADAKTRASIHKIYWQMGVPIDRILAKEDRDPVPGGSVGRVQSNTIPLDSILAIDGPEAIEQKSQKDGSNA